MPICKKCNKKFPNWKIINGKRRCLSSRKYCLECSKYGKHNTKKIHEKQVDKLKPIKCSSCERTYMYSRKKGHTLSLCNSCVVIKSRGNLKKKAAGYKGGKCEICGYNKCNGSLCFHHVDPKNKGFEIGSAYSLGWEKIRLELDKCILLCLNCHGEIHYKPHEKTKHVEKSIFNS